MTCWRPTYYCFKPNTTYYCFKFNNTVFFPNHGKDHLFSIEHQMKHLDHVQWS